MSTKNIVVVIVVAIVFAAGGFFGGIKYQAAKKPAVVAGRGGQFAGAAGNAGRRGGSSGASFVGGQVLSTGTNTLTVKNMNGGSQIVILAPSTQYREAVDGTASDVAVGSMVTVTGTTNSDGSLTAQSVQIRSSSSTPAAMSASGK